MVCMSCMKKKTSTRGVTFSKKDIAYYNMSYKWSEPTWQFFHSFAAKIQEEFYKSHVAECLILIKEICGVLPCPYCQSHANNFFKNINPNNISTKDTFKLLLLNFHNDVNKKTNKPLITLNDLKVYENSNFINISKNFISIFGSYNGNKLGGGFMDSLGRKKTLNKLINWINTYYTFFL